MAFPSIRSSATTNGTGASATPVVNLPATVRAGDTLAVYFRSAAGGALGFPAGWSELVDAAPDASGDQIGIAWKKADGSEGGTTITLSSANARFSAISRSVRDAADPLIRPPEISAVAIGTTGEPNPNAVTPTGGAKDYLWDTVFLMEGEQTGITANPSGYTLDQQFANSGTGGAVTTNCTVGAVARTNNASSENAAAWDVAGTLDDSVAYTLAFHPAEEVPVPLAPDWEWPIVPAPRLTSTMAALTIAVNLLQSTLAPVEATPFSQQVWPNPPRAERLITSVQTLPTDDADRAFAQHAWPNPQLKPPAGVTWLVSLLQSTLAPVEETPPVVPPLWPLPTLADSSALTWIQTRPVFAVDESPAAQHDWPVPLRARVVALTWLQGRKPHDVDASPHNQRDWPLPLVAGRLAPSWLQGRPLGAVDEPAVAQTDWPVPAQRRAPALTWIVNPIHSTLSLAPAPVTPIDWRNPSPRPAAALTWTSSRALALVDEKIERQSDWPIPRTVTKPALTWTQERPFFYAEPGTPPPGVSIANVNPQIGRRNAVGWTQARPTFAVDTKIERQTDWPLPRVAIKPALTHLQQRPFFYAEPGTPPPGVSIAVVNPLVGGRNAVGSVQSRPGYYVDAKIDRQSDWPLPRIATRPAITWLQSGLALVTPPDQPPFNRQTNWPIPVRATVPALSWIQTRQPLHVDAGIPRAFDLSLPVRARTLPPTWISSTLALDVPLRPVAWSVPPPAPRPALTWVVNLLDSTLAGAPLIGSELTLPRLRPAPALTWLQTRPSFYQDEQPFAQHDWPNPLWPKAILVYGWIDSATPAEILIARPVVVCNPDVRSLMPARTFVSLQPPREVQSLMPRRTIAAHCLDEEP